MTDGEIEVRRKIEIIGLVTGAVGGITSGQVVVTSGVVVVTSGQVASLDYGYDLSDGTWKGIPLYKNQLLTIVNTGAINVANFPSTINAYVTNFPSVYNTQIITGSVNAFGFGYDTYDSTWKSLPLYQNQVVALVATGAINIANWQSGYNVAVQQQGFMGLAAISTGYVGAGTGVITTPISIYYYRTKTIQGWTQFDGVLKIYTSYSPGQVHPYPYYSINISSGTTFTASFTEAFAEVVIEIDNTSSTTGLAFVAIDAGVL